MIAPLFFISLFIYIIQLIIVFVFLWVGELTKKKEFIFYLIPWPYLLMVEIIKLFKYTIEQLRSLE